jgi:hypothetical protein
MKIMMTVIALSLSVSAFAEQPKHAAGVTQAELAKGKGAMQKQPGQPTISEAILTKIREQQKRYMDYLREKNLEEEKLTPEERAHAIHESQM